MIWLIVIAIGSFAGAAFMLYKRIVAIQPHLESHAHHAHTNFIADFLHIAKNRVCKYFDEIYTELRPHLHDLMSYLASKMYKLSSAAAQEFLRFYNFIQGRKELKKTGSASAFIRDMAERSEQKTVVRVARKRVAYQPQTANK